jgi:phytoene dehydrogenase-like protein
LLPPGTKGANRDVIPSATATINARDPTSAIVGNVASPYPAGSAYVLLHHAFGEINGKKGEWGHAIGGMGAIS